MLLCVAGIPERGLRTGQVYEQLDFFRCRCERPNKPWPLVSVSGTIGRLRPCVCPRCGARAPSTAMGWYASQRFIPLPRVKGRETKEDKHELA